MLYSLMYSKDSVDSVYPLDSEFAILSGNVSTGVADSGANNITSDNAVQLTSKRKGRAYLRQM